MLMGRAKTPFSDDELAHLDQRFRRCGNCVARASDELLGSDMLNQALQQLDADPQSGDAQRFIRIGLCALVMQALVSFESARVSDMLGDVPSASPSDGTAATTHAHAHTHADGNGNASTERSKIAVAGHIFPGPASTRA